MNIKGNLTKIIGLGALSFFLILPLLADTWGSPQKLTVISANRQYAFTIIPSRSRTDTCKGILYSLHKFSAEELTELLRDTLPAHIRSREDQGPWRGIFYSYWHEHLDERRAAWNKPLMNKLSPGAALVTNSGQVVTFDDHANLGYGPNVIVVYDTTGEIVHRYSLEDLVSWKTVLCIKHTVNSIWWRKSFWFEDNDSTLAVQLDQSNHWGLKCPDSDTIRVPLY
jgi:hypothetical protein